jgi:hypothetical protein
MKIFDSLRHFVIAAVCLTALCGCAGPVDHTIAGAIRHSLPTSIGPARNYAVFVDSDPLEAAKGHLRKVDIIGLGVNLSPQILVDELDIHILDVDANPLTRKVKSVGPVTFAATISQTGIDHYLATQPDDSKQKQDHLEVAINQNSITATVRVKTLGVAVPASVTGTFQIDRGNPQHLSFVPDSGSFSVISVPGFALRLVLNEVNPVIDLSKSTVPVSVDSISINSGKIQLTGEADLQQGLVQGT